MQALPAAWFFAPFVEAAGGFGTPVAQATALLHGLLAWILLLFVFRLAAGALVYLLVRASAKSRSGNIARAPTCLRTRNAPAIRRKSMRRKE